MYAVHLNYTALDFVPCPILKYMPHRLSFKPLVFLLFVTTLDLRQFFIGIALINPISSSFSVQED